MFRAGDRIGSYVLKERIGKGAFGIVWLAEETTSLTSHKFALKLPNEEHVDTEAIRQEAILWEQVKGHPNILPIIKADIVDNQIYIASEYAPDGSLCDWLKRHNGKAPSLSDAVEMAKGILSGLAHLHSKKVIHRDLKPDNILLQGEIPRIADFGIARILKESHSSQIAGTPSYMAPEGFKGIRSEQTDIWAAGVIFYQLITGLLPYPQTDLVSLMNAIVCEKPQIDSQKIPKQLLRIINKALEKEPSNRYQSALRMKEDLKKIQLVDLEDGERQPSLAHEPLIPNRNASVFDRIPQDKSKVSSTLSTELMQITAQDKQDTESLKPAVATTSLFVSRNKVFKWGGAVLATCALILGVTYAVINFNKSSNETKPTPKPLPFKIPVENKTKWAEWAGMLETDEFDKIIKETTKEIEGDPNNPIAYRMRATAYYNLSQDEPARMDIREVLRLTEMPVAAEEYEARCYALKILNKSDEALKNCTKAIEMDSDLSLAYNVRGTIYQQKQMYEQAIAEYTEAVRRSPRATFFRNRATCYREMGKITLALTDEKMASKLTNSYNHLTPSSLTGKINKPDTTKSAILPKPQPQLKPVPSELSGEQANKKQGNPNPKKVTIDDIMRKP